MSRPTCLHPGRLTTSQVVRVPSLVLARATLRSWLMFYVGTFSPQRPTSSCQRANPNVSRIGIEINTRTAFIPPLKGVGFRLVVP